MNKHYEDNQKVLLKETGEEVTIAQWAIAKGPGKITRYTYTLKEKPETFFFHNELQPLEVSL